MSPFIFITLLCLLYGTTGDQIPKSYVVYMGSSTTNNNAEDSIEAIETAHMELLSSILLSEKERPSLVHVYNHAFKGFSAMLTEKEASLLSSHDGILSVFPDPTLQLHTTRSWEFLRAESAVGFKYRYPSTSSNVVIIGVMDTGIWPESFSFSDKGIGKIPSKWRGSCMEGPGFKRSNCNRKLIGARYYDSPDQNSTSKVNPTGSPRDELGHGTHTASTAAGAPVANANYFGLGKGTAKGGSPGSRLAVYKVCSSDGCSGATLLKAMDDAIKDGVDMISISIGVDATVKYDFLNDPIAIGAFHANQKGVMVICSAGNEGPDPYTIVNSAPWIFTVAASSIDREFQSKVVLGNGHVLKGSAINFSKLTASKLYPLAYGKSIAAISTKLSDSRNCVPGSLDTEKVAGKIIICLDTKPLVKSRTKKEVAEAAGAKGVILIDNNNKKWPSDYGVFPFSQIGNVHGNQLLKYIKSTKNPRAAILETVQIDRFKPAPVVAYFSSRGPGQQTENILKPDISAPGVGILAAIVPKAKAGSVPPGKKPSPFAIKSGTSMSCPHVAGAAAFIKSVRPRWSPSMIKSALMTTAIVVNNMGRRITNSSQAVASPHEAGAGEISPTRALSPGLVYETTTTDYLHFLCYYGYREKTIRSVSGQKFTCPEKSTEDFISDINYPSISISKLKRRRSSRMVKRTVTNVGPKNSTYTVKVDSPANLGVSVWPRKLRFSQGSTKASFKVSFRNKGSSKGYQFGSITWFDGVHVVRTPFVVNVA